MILNLKKRSLCKFSTIVFTTLAFSACNAEVEKNKNAEDSDMVSNTVGQFDRKCYYRFSEAPKNTKFHAVAMNVDVKEDGSLKGELLELACPPADINCQTDLPTLVDAVTRLNETQRDVDKAFLAIQTYWLDKKRDEDFKAAFIEDKFLDDLNSAFINLSAAESSLNPTPIDLKKLKKSTNLAYILKDEYWSFTGTGLEAKPLDTTKPIPFSPATTLGKKASSIKYYRKGVGNKCRYGFDLDIIVTDSDITLSTPIRVDPLIGNDGGGIGGGG